MQPTASKNATRSTLPTMLQAPRPNLRSAAQLAAGGLYVPPYPWDVPPPNHNPRHIMGSAIAPGAYGAANQVEILHYIVPSSMYFCLAGIVLRFDGTGFVQGSGDVVMSLDINNPTTGTGTGFSTGYTLPDYGQVIFNLGSLGAFSFPWPMYNKPIFQPNDRIGMKGFTLANVGLGAPNRFNGMLVGWEWPVAS